MILGPVFERFLNESPISVMARATIEHALSASALDALFEHTAERGYTRELLFSTTVDLMSLVVCGTVPHVQSAYKHLLERVPVTLKCVYEKLQHLEIGVSAELVRHVAGRCEGLITELGGACQTLLSGYRVRILDGNHLAATQKRLKVTRGHRAGPLPGQSLAVLDPALMLISDVILCEDAHTQERALIAQVLPLVHEGDVWIEDRNFCTVDFMHGVAQRRAYFVARRHGNLTIEPQAEFGPEVETKTGWVSERAVWVGREGQHVLPARLVRVRLKQPTEDGDWEVELVTNLPVEVADAAKVASLYLKRWKIEGAFHELTMALNCEVNTLGYPKAALFGFSVAVVAYNVLAVLKAALRAVHGEKRVQEEVSGYYLALEWAVVYAGMMIALPADQWEVFGSMSSKELADSLRDWACKINLEKIKKAPPRKPTKEKTKPIKDKSPHLSTARLLDQAKKKRQEKPKSLIQR
jgi:Transposase DDE domain